MSRQSLRERVLGLSDATVFVLVVLAVLAFAFVFTYPRQWSRGLLINDEMWYGHLARSVYEGQGYVTNTIYPMQASEVDSFPAPEAFKQAGYPLLTALAWTLTGTGHRAMVLLALAGFGLAAGLIYLLARALGWGRFPSLFLPGAIVFSPSVAVPLTAALPESWYLALFVGTLLLVLRRTPASLAAAGLTHAALLIVKGHAILYVPVVLVWLVVAGRGLGWKQDGRDAGRGRRREAGGAEGSDAGELRDGGESWTRIGCQSGAYAGALAVGRLAAMLLLPSGSVQLFQSGGNYSLALLIDTDGYPADELPYYQLDPPDAVGYILDNPAEYAEKYLRMISRTKVILEGLGGPALGGVLFLLLGVSVALLLVDLAREGWILPRAGPATGAAVTDRKGDEPEAGSDGDRGDGAGRHATVHRRAGADRRDARALFLGALAVTFLFFWGVHLTARFVLHTYPLMLLLVFEVAGRLEGLGRDMKPRLRATLAGLAVLYVVVYPAAASLWQSYRDPWAHLGRQLAVRFADYGEVAADVEGLPAGPVVSDMGHEIEWFTGRPTILFPLTDEELRILVDKYDVVALYEHPILERDWPWMKSAFRLVDDDNGRFWVRRGSRVFPGDR